MRKQNAHVLVLDAGNSLVGDQPYTLETKGAISVNAMNRMGYDAMALGPMDLRLGEDTLRQRMKQAQFPFLSANVRIEGGGELLAQDYVVRDIGGHRVAIIGLTETSTVAGFSIADPIATIKQLMPEVVRQADIVILLTHTPVSVARQIAAQVAGIDLIVCGGDEPLPVGEMTSGGTLIVRADTATPGHAGRYIGIAQVDFDEQGKIAHQTNTIVPLSETLPEDPDMVEWLRQAVQ